ncbi:MAG TPA: hypothetical protein VN213_00615 [Solirubrobacteraceae bacterium]|nr:hypothetical protein [Solirubrobacteraceae bacterium]
MGPISHTELVLYAVAVAILAVLVHRFRRLVFRGVPDLSAPAVGLLRIALGLALLRALPRLELPDAAPGGGSESEAALWGPAGWVEYLGTHWDLRDALLTATFVALVAFTVGAAARIAYALAVLGIVVRLTVAQEYGVGSHAWVIAPLVLAPLVIVRWGDALSVDALVRRLRRRPSAARPPGPHYGLAVWLPGLTLGCAWAAAAYAKLHNTGIEWITSGAVRYHWAEDYLSAKVDWGGWVAGNEPVAIFLSACGVGIELLFVTHIFFRSQWVRLAYGLAGASLLAGFYLFQGVLWYAWWTILLFFLPWQAMADLLARGVAAVRRAGRGATERPADRFAFLGRTAPVAAAIVAFLVVQQAAMAREGVEQMPFFSNYPMYSYTRESPAEFNAELAPIKFYRYRVLAEGAGPPRDVTSRLDPNQVGYLRDAALWRMRYGDDPLDEDQREALATVRDSYRERFGEDLRRVRLLTTPRLFDFANGGLTTKGAPRVPPFEIDLEAFSARPVSSETA